MGVVATVCDALTDGSIVEGQLDEEATTAEFAPSSHTSGINRRNAANRERHVHFA